MARTGISMRAGDDLTSMDALGSAAVLLGIKLKEESK